MSFQYPLISESDEATFCLKINVRNHNLLEVFRTAPIATCVQRMLLGMQPGLGRVRTPMMLALVLDQSRHVLIWGLMRVSINGGTPKRLVSN